VRAFALIAALPAVVLAVTLPAGAPARAAAAPARAPAFASAAVVREQAGQPAHPPPTPKTTLPAVEAQAMCVTCKIPLQVAQSPQADRERAFIARLIAAGLTETQIKRALVREYGPAVLALPPGHGFDLAVYLVPIALVAGLLALLAVLLPRWRRRGREGFSGTPGPSPTIAPADAARLEADMARFD
jgi:cytochrome c-type biogenesis protein CcmH